MIKGREVKVRWYELLPLLTRNGAPRAVTATSYKYRFPAEMCMLTSF